MHAFDLNKVAGRTIDVRRAHEGEKIVTLDEKEFTLNPNNLVICDAEKPVALAGIMGGANSGMDDNTTSLLFECATFARDSCVRPAVHWVRTAIPLPATRRAWIAILRSWVWHALCT